MLADLADLVVFLFRGFCLMGAVIALTYACYSFFVQRFDPWVRWFFILVGLALLMLGVPVFF
jgi:hypothetical protein